jgi:hypothetical protein
MTRAGMRSVNVQGVVHEKSPENPFPSEISSNIRTPTREL